MMQAQRSATQHSTAQYALCGCRVFAAASVTRGGEAGACTTQCTCTLYVYGTVPYGTALKRSIHYTKLE